ncbi:hypothetical protein LTR62_000470 [Meristemomyces frigidus]|uniref:Peptidase S53 domain-containing protein n=1 Tax=Meristemomyces frigidus TaxID=1508187 RepID=A0AAN7YQZ7_9PEZI|nr:hypothetical protein LTR62_000470 [Meristemomyces frigidus]
MRIVQIFGGLLGLAAAAASASAPPGYVQHEKREHQPARWTKLERARGILPMRIGLVQTNLDRAHDHLMDLSHPDSANYGKHWTAQQVIDAFKPSQNTVQTVQQWLEDSGITGVTLSDNKAWLAFHATVEQAEKLLRTEYHEYEDVHTGGVLPACDQYHLPRHIQQHVDYITPGIKLLAPEGIASSSHDIPLTKRGDSEGEIGLHRNSKSVARTRGPHVRKPKAGPPVNASDLSICDQVITPACVAALYHIPMSNLTSPNANNSLGIFEAEIQFWDQTDLNLFYANFTPTIPNNTHPISLNIDGGRAQTNYSDEGGPESMLDLELAYPIVYPQNITVYNVDDIHYQTWPNDTYTWGFNTLLDAIDGSYCTFSAYNETGNLANWDPTYPDPAFQGYNGTLQCGIFKPTNIISLSYGGQEVDVPIAYQKRQCLEFLKLGLQGVSFLFASGDSGVGNYAASAGGIDGPTGCLGPNYNIFNPTWPNTCPYITNVGGTKVYPGHNITEAQPESAVYDPSASNYSSGGGFSNIYPIPSYQAGAIATYFADHEPQYPYYCSLAPANATTPYDLLNITALAASDGNGTGIYNRLGRGVPDVSANGDNIATFIKGAFALSGGTSASTPIFAAILNRINEERLAVGKGPVGFANPVLYAHPEVLNDVVNGSNPACGTEGFRAAKGWDPVTGLGTPRFPEMLELWLGLP